MHNCSTPSHLFLPTPASSPFRSRNRLQTNYYTFTLLSCAWADMSALSAGGEMEKALQLLCPSSALFNHLNKGLAENR